MCFWSVFLYGRRGVTCLEEGDEWYGIQLRVNLHSETYVYNSFTKGFRYIQTVMEYSQENCL